ncbi:MAG: response regulator transcription factor [Anaerolineae bacterium]|nr:response regulator transcription factor [Anaerolineae bacterium]
MTQKTAILLIEDDPGIAHSLTAGLGQAGYTVYWKDTGSDGLRHAIDHNPHLIILDLRLPDQSGFDVCRQLRQKGLYQPILMLTVQRDEMDKVLGLEMGADDYLTKPYSLRELLSRVRALLRRAYGEFSAADADRLYLGDLTLDRSSNQLRRGDELINLTPTEFKILVYLARHPGQALSRAQIVEAVWGHDADVESERTVNVHIRRLREKIELDPGQPTLVLTVPGIGYRLVK